MTVPPCMEWIPLFLKKFNQRLVILSLLAQQNFKSWYKIVSLELLVAVNSDFSVILHCVKSVQIRSYFWSVFSCFRTEYGDLLRKSPNTGKYGPEITPYLDTCHAVLVSGITVSKAIACTRVTEEYRNIRKILLLNSSHPVHFWKLYWNKN